MSLSSEKSAELHELVGQLCNEDLRRDAFQRLAALLDGDGEAQKLYVRYLDMHQSLCELAVGLDERAALVDIQGLLTNLAALGSPSLKSDDDMPEAEPGSCEPSHAMIADAHKSAITAPFPIGSEDHHPLIASPSSSPVIKIFSVGTICWTLFALLLALIMAWFGGILEQPENHRERASKQIAASSATDGKATGISSVSLDSGIANLTLPGIGHVVVEGPAEFDLVAPLRARLISGRIKMRVTEETGRGFVVETPYGEVTDLGTEFGLDLTEQGHAGLVVFEGAVDLRIPKPGQSELASDAPAEQFVCGDAVAFGGNRMIERISAIRTGKKELFQICSESLTKANASVDQRSLIANVRDNLSAKDTKKFYEIVPGGLDEDALAYVDRGHQWNGIDYRGIPKYLLGADYVKAFNADVVRKNIKVSVTLARPAKLYLFCDDRLEAPHWLRKDFRNTGDKIGLEGVRRKGKSPHGKVGPGANVREQFSIWERVVLEPTTITLGPPSKKEVKKGKAAMFGIAAVPLESKDKQLEKN